jgi:hypothetical protein
MGLAYNEYLVLAQKPSMTGQKQEKELYTLCCPGALSLETLSLEKAAISLCSPRALGLD